MQRTVKFILLLAGIFPMLTLSTTAQAQDKAIEVEIHKGLKYYTGKDAHPTRHQLDLYVPKGKKNFPVVFFVHGGAWRHGDKNHFGMYAAMGKMFVKNGIGFVSINYRLSPSVKHPTHVEDVAKAFAWVKANIAKYGGRPDELFVSGHSAGGHLCALLATNERYLKAHKLCLGDICGAMPMSGPFLITDSVAFRDVFGREKEVIREASPISHAGPDVPPFLLIFADSELPGCGRRVAQLFHNALVKNKASSGLLEVKKRNHITVMLGARRQSDPAAQAMLNFVRAQVVAQRILNKESSGWTMMAELLTTP